MVTKKNKAEIKVVIRLSGETLEKAMDLKATREKRRGKPISLARIIRDTVEMTWLAKEIHAANREAERTEELSHPRKQLEEILHPLGLNVDEIINTYGKIREEQKNYIHVKVAGDAFAAVMSMQAKGRQKENGDTSIELIVRKAILAKEEGESGSVF